MKKRSTKLARQHFAELLLAACLVLSVCWLPIVGATASGTATEERWITETNRTGDSIIKTVNGTAYVWQSETHSITVNFTAKQSDAHYSVCLYTASSDEQASDENRREIDCQTVSRAENGSVESVTIDAKNRKLNNRTVTVELSKSFSDQDEPLDTRTLDYEVVRKDGDEDRDGLTNAYEVEHDLNITNPDIDKDGYSDGREVKVYGTDPKDRDTDGDGIPDGAEIKNGTNANGTATATETTLGERTSNRTQPRNQTEPPALSVPIRSEFIIAGFIVLGGVSVVLLWRYDERDGQGDHGGRGSDHGGSGSEGGVSMPTSSRADVPTSSTQTPGDAASTQSRSPPSIPDDEVLLTDEDRLYELIYENNGRMKQADIVEEMDWSKSKVSRLLSEMEENGVVNKVRLGRGNVIYLEEATPDAALNPQWARDEADESETDEANGSDDEARNSDDEASGRSESNDGDEE